MALKERLTPQLTRRQYISIAKGVLCYTLVFVLVFLRGFNSLIDYPIVLTSMVIVSIAGQPGLSVGACLDNGLYGMLGVGVGAFWFFVLAKITSRVGQGFVFFFVVYVLALIKAQSLRYFAFSLLAVLVSFSGIYTSILLGGPGHFSAPYLEAYLQAYCWGFALVLGINILILPVSSERELRELLVLSLEHLSTFTHLIAKTYSMEITDEERVVRDQLNQSIRADFGLLQVKTAHAGLEVNWTRWSMADYSGMVAKIKQMQQGLITSYSSLVVMEKFEPAALEIIKRGLEETATGKAFKKLRLGFDLSISDIVKELAVGKQEYHSPAPGASWDDFLDLEDEEDLEAGRSRPRAPSVSPGSPQIRDQLALVTARLRTEVQGADNSPMASRRGSFTGEKQPSEEGTTAVPSLAPDPTPKRAKDLKSLDRVAFLRGCWDHFKMEQNEAITRLLARGIVDDDELRLHKPAPSLYEQFVAPQGETVRTHAATAVRPAETQPKQRKGGKKSAEKEMETVEQPIDEAEGSAAQDGSQSSGESKSQSTTEIICGTSVLRVFSFIFGMGGVVDNLASLHDHVVPRDEAHCRPKRLHFHLFETIPKAAKASGIPLRRALAILSGRDFVEKKVSWWVRVARLERMARTPTSIYAFKTACAVSVYAVFLLAPSLTSFFTSYGLTGGLITIVVAMAPTLGQTVLTFVLQVLGTGFGTLYGLLILRIFLDVGGFHFNPYGLVCLIALYAVPLVWIIYLRPMFFAGALLAMNGTGVLVITEWVYTSVPGQIRPGFDSPAFRAGKAFVALAIALAIAGIFQIFILRNPARQTLRLKLSQITFSLGSYSILLGLMIEAQAPIETTCDPNRPPPDPEAMASVRDELVRREGQIQGELLGLMPLMKFSAAEPAFGQPFQGPVMARIIRSHQLILDRLREARTAIGVDGFSADIRKNFTNHLAPYRRQNKRFTRALFYLISTSLATKEPLPHELPTMITAARNIQHDALVLSSRLSTTEEGREVLRSQGFVRYWFYLTAYSGVSYNLEAMETDLRLLLGEVEESPFVTQERDSAA